ncbi:MAG: hypothetical protein K8I03_09740 [Ignavibacteria bacterium]|nr:hypothetical protein [Ignavibacteria bacterium]
MNDLVDKINDLLNKCSKAQKRTIFDELRKEFKIHTIEETLNISAEIILEALSKGGEKGLTLRMLRGVIAEAAFAIEVLSNNANLRDITPRGDFPYDYLVSDAKIDIKFQVKLQRSIDNKPMLANDAKRSFPKDMFVVETQKTRAGQDSSGQGTRSYKFGEFDILAVSLQPSSNNWASFMYTVSDWLVPDETDKAKIFKFQPVPKVANQDWTDDVNTAIKWLKSKKKKTIKH